MYARDSHQSRLLTELQFKRSLIECTKRANEKANISADRYTLTLVHTHKHIDGGARKLSAKHDGYIKCVLKISWVLYEPNARATHTRTDGMNERLNGETLRVKNTCTRGAFKTWEFETSKWLRLWYIMRMASSKRNANKRICMVYGAAYAEHRAQRPTCTLATQAHSTHIFHSYISFKNLWIRHTPTARIQLKKLKMWWKFNIILYITNCDDYKLHKKGKKCTCIFSSTWFR